MQPGRLRIKRDAQPPRALDGVCIRKISMRHDEAAVSDGPFAISGFVRIEQRVGSAATGRVRGHLPAEPVRHAGHFDEVLTRHGQHTSVLWVVIAVDGGVLAIRFS